MLSYILQINFFGIHQLEVKKYIKLANHITFQLDD